jgi:sugar O-acyltransferase (sialic acid O-acetyltransferase NeuD family)
MSKIIIVGGFVEIIELCEANGITIFGLIDNCDKKMLYSHKVLGNDKDASIFANDIKKYPLIIAPDIPAVRKKLKMYYQDLGYDFAQLVSSHSKVSKSASIGRGTIIQSGVNVSSEVKIGDFVKLNCLANIMHNSEVGNYTTIAPNAVILGNVTVGKECYIGANATILPHIKIADNVTVGAGSVVTKYISEQGSVSAGVPAKRIK